MLAAKVTRAAAVRRPVGPNYKWIALSNTTLGVLMATVNSSIMLIALPNIFRGIKVNPLIPSNTSYLLWMILSFLIVTAVLVVSLGRFGDMYGRVRTYNLGFAVFTFFSILLTVTWMTGSAAALWIIGMRVGQGVGGALLFANSSAIVTDAFPEDERGLALGINSVAAIAGSFIGLVLGGLLGPVQWRLVFFVSVPIGLFGTVWAYLKLREVGVSKAARIDWWGNVTFAVGLIAVMIGITYGIQPYGTHTMGWTAPSVDGWLISGVVVLIAFCVIETRVKEPMFRLPLFKIRAFTAGNVASLLSAIGRGGLMFILIIWLQGVWLPEHGYAFAITPLWAGIYMLPLTVGFLIAGPIAGILTDRYGARPFATGGMVVAAAAFVLLMSLPVSFSYIWFALTILLMGVGMGMFSSPNRTGIMNSLPPNHRGVGAGMSATFQNSAMVLSIGIFFSLMIVGMSATLPHSLYSGMVAHDVPHAVATQISHLPPVSSLFAALLGYNPMQTLLAPHGVLASMQVHHALQAHIVTGREFFPQLLSKPFSNALQEAFIFGAGMCLVAAVASMLRGGKYHWQEESVTVELAAEGQAAGSVQAETQADRQDASPGAARIDASHSQGTVAGPVTHPAPPRRPVDADAPSGGSHEERERRRARSKPSGLRDTRRRVPTGAATPRRGAESRAESDEADA